MAWVCVEKTLSSHLHSGSLFHRQLHFSSTGPYYRPLLGGLAAASPHQHLHLNFPPPTALAQRSVRGVYSLVQRDRQRRKSVRLFAWFKFGKNGLDAEGAGVYGSQGRDDFDRDDVEQYFNYMGMLATEGSYDKMEALLAKGIHPIDILLLLAASENDTPKIEELIRAGADFRVPDVEGRTALDRAGNEDVRQLISGAAKSVA